MPDGLVETTTRLPLGAPLVSDRDGPELQAATGFLFVVFVIGAALQVRRMRKRGARAAYSTNTASIAARSKRPFTGQEA